MPRRARRRRPSTVLLDWLALLWMGLLACLFFCSACRKQNAGPVHPYWQEPYPRNLSDWRLFVGGGASLRPNQGVIPYDVRTQLFKDYADKFRFVWMPPGASAVYRKSGVFDFPVGTIFSKTFAYPLAHSSSANRPKQEELIETRLLVHSRTGWVGLPYVWNKDQTEATLEVAPDPTHVSWTDPSGRIFSFDYIIPDMNQCKGCHENARVMAPLGPKALNLNKDFLYPKGRYNQLVYWTRIGYLKGAPDLAPRMAVWDDPNTGSVEERARAYLDVQCAHCHNPQGPANTSGLYLATGVTDSLRLGVCKTPVSAGQGTGGRLFDIVPGKPDESILVYRMESSTPKVMMPELGRTLAHQEGVALIREWVSSLQGGCAPGGAEASRLTFGAAEAAK